MSILIKGMEMPDSCSNCELCACYNESKGEVYRCDITMHPIKYFEKRLDNCPLVPVPPHGRLIESKAFLQVAHETDDFSLDELAHLAVLVAATPTIIPAEEGEN